MGTSHVNTDFSTVHVSVFVFRRNHLFELTADRSITHACVLPHSRPFYVSRHTHAKFWELGWGKDHVVREEKTIS